MPVCEFCQYRRAVCEHHLLPKSQSGKDEDKVWLCHTCHVEAHKNTRAFRAKFLLKKKGLLRAKNP